MVVKSNWMRILKPLKIERFFSFKSDKFLKDVELHYVIFKISLQGVSKMKKFLVLFGFMALAMSKMTLAQDTNDKISLDLRDAPIRSTLELAFKQANIKNYVIDNEVAGFITMTITDLPFENTLKLIMRASSIPLTYVKENDVYIVKVRKITEFKPTPAPDFSIAPPTSSVIFERIPLTYIDPMDLVSAFGNILYIGQFQRYGGGMSNGMMGGMGMGGGMMGGGMMGGMGGIGGGMGMGGQGGGMMGGMGSFGGGMGGNGGFGGGRNF